jgi:hypothetical protein
MSTASKSNFAREHDVTPTTVTNWVKRGYAIENEDGRIEREISNRKLADRPIVYRGGRLGGNAPGCPWVSKRRTREEWDVELIRATLARLKAAGVKLATEEQFIQAADEVLVEWRDVE